MLIWTNKQSLSTHVINLKAVNSSKYQLYPDEPNCDTSY